MENHKIQYQSFYFGRYVRQIVIIGGGIAGLWLLPRLYGDNPPVTIAVMVLCALAISFDAVKQFNPHVGITVTDQ